MEWDDGWWDAWNTWELSREEMRRAIRVERAKWVFPAALPLAEPTTPTGDALLKKRIALNTL